jgi:hypothetical protein
MPDAAETAADARATLRAEVDDARAEVAKCEKAIADHDAEIAREEAAARERAATRTKNPKATDGDDDDDADDAWGADPERVNLDRDIDIARYKLERAEALLSAAEGKGDVSVLDKEIADAQQQAQLAADPRNQVFPQLSEQAAKRLALLQAARAGISVTPPNPLVDAPEFTSGQWGGQDHIPDEVDRAVDDVIAHDQPSALGWGRPATAPTTATDDATGAVDDVIAHDQPSALGWGRPAGSAGSSGRRIVVGSLLFFGVIIVGFGIHAMTSSSGTKTTPAAATPTANAPAAPVAVATTIPLAGAAVTLEQVSQSGCTTNVIAHAKIADPTFVGDQAVLRITGPGGGDFPFTVPAGGNFDMPFTENGCDTWNYAIVSVNGIPTAAAGGH